MSTFGDLSPDNTIVGGTDSTTIGNNGDRLKVDASISGYSQSGLQYGVSTGSTGSSFGSSGTRKSIISLRKKSTQLSYNLDGVDVNLLGSTTDNFLVEIVRDATIVGGSWLSGSTGAEYNVTSASVSGGVVMYSKYFSGISSGLIDNIRCFETFAGSLIASGQSGSYSVVMTNLTSSATVYGSINYREYL